jgi:hypothetical protein
MTLRGASFLAIWNDIEGITPAEYDAWLTHEHMAERLAVPGFLRGRRFVAGDELPHRYFICYETRDAGVMTSPAYLERLNNPTPLTQRVMPCLSNFLRMGCRTLGSAGQHVGGALATVRFEAPVDQVERSAQSLCDALVRNSVFMGAHVGSPEAAVAAAPTRERELRPALAQEGAEDHVLLVESANDAALRAELPAILEALRTHMASASPAAVRVYALSCLVDTKTDAG